MKKIFRLYVPVIPDNRANPPTLLNTAILQRKLHEPGHDIFNVRANFFLFSSIIAHLRTNWDKTKEKADLSISSLPEFNLFQSIFEYIIWHIFACFSARSFWQILSLFSQSRDRLVSTEMAALKAPAIRAFKVQNADGSENLNSKSLSRCLLFHLNQYVKCGRIRLQVNYQNRIHVQKEKEKLDFLCLPFIRKFHIVLLKCSDRNEVNQQV